MDSDYFISALPEQIVSQGFAVDPVMALALAFFLLLVIGFLSAAEAAFYSLSPENMNDISAGKTPSAFSLQNLLEHTEQLLASVWLANKLVVVAFILLCAYGCVSFSEFSSMEPGWLIVLETIVLVVVLLLFGDMLPKSLVRKAPIRFLRRHVWALNVVGRLLYPFSKFLIPYTNQKGGLLLRRKSDLSVDELSKALERTATESPEEKVMLSEIIKFYNKTANEIMTPRLDIEDLDVKAQFRDVIDFVVKSGYSRIPVYEESEDDIKGILYIKDLLSHVEEPDTFNWQSLIRPAYFVPETKKIDDLLEEFRSNKIHMAIVVDEFGGTSGLITMEDILEEIVGEISDEYDDDVKQFIRLADGSYIFEAKIQLIDFFRVIGVNPSEFGKLTDEVETLGGLLLEIKGDIPNRRDIIRYGKYQFQILEVDNRRILKVKFSRIPEFAE